MSFYGNRLYQLTNAFGKIFVKNSGKLATTFFEPTDPANNDDAAFALGLETAYTFDTGNKWVTLNRDNDNGICFISHSAADIEGDSNLIAPLEKLTEEQENSVQLMAGDYIAIPNISYDAAGHVIGTEGQNYFRLPMSQTELDLDNIKERVTGLENSDITQNGSLNDLNNYCDGLTQDIGKINNFIGNISNITEEEESELTLATAIGNMDKVVKNYGDISTAINTLASAVAQNTTAFSFIINLIDGLQGEIDKLKSYHDSEGQ